MINLTEKPPDLVAMEIKQLSEPDFYNLSENDNGIFYYKSNWPRWFCFVKLPNQRAYRNIWNVEKHAFEWMNKFKEDFNK